jgi:HSP20 family protein
MELTRFEPGTDLFRSFFEEFWPRPDVATSYRMFEADVVEMENEIRVMADLPGVRLEDLDLTLEANVLTISGEKRNPQEEERHGRYHLFERRWGRFSRSFVLPREVERENVSASFDHGVLTVRIPKTETARRRRIEIQAGEGQRRLESHTR